VTYYDYDLVIIGAGIHGAGVAQAAAAAGYRVLVLERTGIAAATSSQSSKLIHGGLRYLETGQFRLVRESLRERALLLKLAPDLVKLTPFYLPIYRQSHRRWWHVRIGLSLYSLLAGFQTDTRFRAVGRHDWQQLDGLLTKDLVAVYRYFDAQTDDALLTRAVMQSAQSLGAELRLPAEFVEAEIENRQCRVIFKSGADETPHECRCAALVNCAGPWAARLLDKIRPSQAPPYVELVQGSHLWLEVEPPSGCYYVEAPSDYRGVFVMPWHGEMLVGTTETPHVGPPEQARTLPAETQYLLDTLGHYFPHLANVSRQQIKHEYCGFRVLPRTGGLPSGRSREVLFHTDNSVAPRLVSVMGGKLTTYRLTAKKVLARLAPSLPPPSAQHDTAQLPLSL